MNSTISLMHRITLLVGCVALFLARFAAGQVTFALTGSGTAGTLATEGGYNNGYRFVTGSNGLIVTWLGFYDAPSNDVGGTVGDGLLSSPTVSLWRESDHALLAATVILSGTNDTLIGDFRGHSIPSVILEPFTAYRIAVFNFWPDRYRDGNDLAGWQTNEIYITGGCYTGGGGYPGGGWSILIGPNFGFEIPLAQILSFGPGATIDPNAMTIAWIVPYGSDVTQLSPTYTVSSGTGEPASGSTKDFSSPVVYTVTDWDLLVSNAYTVTVTMIPASTNKHILTFGPGASITGTDIALSVPYGTDRSMLAPTYTISPLASGHPPSGTTRDFTTPQIYTVTAEDMSTLDYTVTVNVRSDGSDAHLTVTNGLIVWLKAEAIDTSDPAQVRTSGSDLYVQLWNDQSGNDHSASNSTEADQPLYIAGALNGKPVLRFAQVDEQTGSKIYLGDLSAHFPSAATLFTVGTISNDGRYTLFGNRDNDERWVADNWSESTPGSFRIDRADFNFNYALWPHTGSHIFTLESDSSAFKMTMDGTNMGTAAAAYHDGSGTNWIIGNRANPDNGAQLRGDIPELILYNRVLSSNEALMVGAYLAEKYGLSTSYPIPSSPSVDITNSFGTTNVSLGTTVFTIAGTNNAFTIGTIWWTNKTSGSVGDTGGVFLADSVNGWSFNAALSPGTNLIAVSGSNTTGAVYSDWTKVNVVPEPMTIAGLLAVLALMRRNTQTSRHHRTVRDRGNPES